MISQLLSLSIRICGLSITIPWGVIFLSSLSSSSSHELHVRVKIIEKSNNKLGFHEIKILNIFIKRLFIQIIINFRTHSTAWLPWELITRNNDKQQDESPEKFHPNIVRNTGNSQSANQHAGSRGDHVREPVPELEGHHGGLSG